MFHNCRFCQQPLEHVVVDLGLSPVSNHFRDAAGVDSEGQGFYPLKAMVCQSCWLVQLIKVSTPSHFNEDYAYFSSFSASWLSHAETYARKMKDRLGLGRQAFVLEIASNDGYLLQYFKKAGFNVLGVEPSANVAAFAKEHYDIESIVEFFGVALGHKLQQDGVSADLITCNNVLAHVPDINDFVAGIGLVLAHNGTVTFEFPHVLKMLIHRQFDTIYHEHFSYLSLIAVETIVRAHGLVVYDVEELSTHGGSLRVFAKHATAEAGESSTSDGLAKVRTDEARFGLDNLAAYRGFAACPAQCKIDLLSFLIEAHRQSKTVCGYGAPAKGNTLLNYCGIGPELLPFTTDLSPQKQGKFLPGVNIPVLHPDQINALQPDYVLILPWNLRAEIQAQLDIVRSWGGKFVVAIPKLEIF